MSERICFVIAPIGETDSETRKRSDQVLKHVIGPAVLQCGYTALRADKISEPGLITSQVIQHIIDDPLVVADLTERNPNVFYELAVRHALRKPLVQIIRKGEQIPFDVAGMRTIELDHRDLDSADDARNQIISQIRALEADMSKLQTTPISVTIDLQTLRQSDNPEQRSVGEVLAAVAELRTGLASLGSRVEYSIELAKVATKSNARQDLTKGYYPGSGSLGDLLKLNVVPSASDSSVSFISSSGMVLDPVSPNESTFNLLINGQTEKEPNRKK